MSYYFSYKKIIDFAFNVYDFTKKEVKMPTKFIGWARVTCDGFGDGYDHFSMRPDVAKDAQAAIDYLESIGVRISTSGGKRRPSHSANKNQAVHSLHILGLAFDLWVYGGGFWDRDDFVIERDHEDRRKWVVWGKSSKPNLVDKVTLSQWDHKKQKSREITGNFVNLTNVFREYGFTPIPQRRSYPHSYGGSEWWHFQHVSTLVEGVTKFSEAAKLVWSDDDLDGTASIEDDYLWNGKYFKKV